MRPGAGYCVARARESAQINPTIRDCTCIQPDVLHLPVFFSHTLSSPSAIHIRAPDAKNDQIMLADLLILKRTRTVTRDHRFFFRTTLVLRYISLPGASTSEIRTLLCLSVGSQLLLRLKQ